MFRVYIRDTRIMAWSLSWSNIIITGNFHLNLQFLLSLRCENQVFCFDKLRRAKEGNAKEKKRHLHALIGGPGPYTASSQTTGPHVWRAMVAVFCVFLLRWCGVVWPTSVEPCRESPGKLHPVLPGPICCRFTFGHMLHMVQILNARIRPP